MFFNLLQQDGKKVNTTVDVVVNAVTDAVAHKIYFAGTNNFRHVRSTVNLINSICGHFHQKLWKMINKHVNKNKREKTRRLYAHFD